MSTWNVQGEVKGMAKSWRDISPALSAAVERIRAPFGRGIAWEGAEIWAYKDRASSIAEVFDRNVTHFGDQEAYVFYPEGVLGKLTETLQRDEKAKIYGLNAARLFNIEVPAKFAAADATAAR